jgi:hypothetical protein
LEDHFLGAVAKAIEVKLPTPGTPEIVMEIAASIASSIVY